VERDTGGKPWWSGSSGHDGPRVGDPLCRYHLHSSYDHDHQRDLSVLKRVDGDGEGFLIVDDLVDSGSTAKVIRELYPKAKLITIFAKPKGEHLVDDFEVSIPQETWIEQPWDMAYCYLPPLCESEEG